MPPSSGEPYASTEGRRVTAVTRAVTEAAFSLQSKGKDHRPVFSLGLIHHWQIDPTQELFRAVSLLPKNLLISSSAAV